MKLVTRRARYLRSNATQAERRLWASLRRKSVENFRFRRQVPLLGFIVDFVSFEAKLIVEVDGATRGSPEEIARDLRRDAILQDGGFAIIRVRNADVIENLEGVLETIRLKLLERVRKIT